MKKTNYYILGVILILLFIFINFFNNKIVVNKLKHNLFKIQEFITPNLKIDNKIIVKMINKEQEDNIKELNKILNLNENTNYKYINCKVLSNINLYENIITINKGKKDGIEKGMPAVTNIGLIGIVDTVYEEYSYISLLNNKKVSVSIKNNDKEYNGNITNYDLIANKIIITLIRSDSKIEKGNEVYTNGLGEYIPSGIPIGTVKDINIDNETSVKTITVKAQEDLSKVKYIGIIKGIKE